MKKTIPSGVLRNKKTVMLIIVVIAGIIGGCFIGISKFSNNEIVVNYKTVDEDKIPSEIAENVIPEYKSLERALACTVGQKVYVVVTRGEKPSSGFDVSVESLKLMEEDDKTTLVVFAKFKDPQQKTPVSQILTYPICVVKTDLKGLPDEIELRIQY